MNTKVNVRADEDDISVSSGSEGVFTIDNNLYFYCEIYSSNVIKFKKEFESLKWAILFENKKFKSDICINIHINSCGGDVVDSLLLYDLIMEANKELEVNVYVDGAAFSGASVMAMAGKKRYMMKNSFLLIHQIRGVVVGKNSDMQDSNKNWELMTNKFKEVYSKHSNIDPDKLENLLNREIYLSSDDCLEMGLIDYII